MIIWGGLLSPSFFNDGGIYDPLANCWSPTTTNNAPEGRVSHTALWTGSEMIIWGGVGVAGYDLNTGARYNPITDSWSPITTNGAPSPRYGTAAIWTGSEMIIWGGVFDSGSIRTLLQDGARYSPVTDTWSPMTTTGAPLGRNAPTAIWSGSEMIMWGGVTTDGTPGINSGARYNPATDTWSPTTTNGVPAGRVNHTAVWTGHEMIVWGGDGFGLNDGGRYDPVFDSWQLVTTTSAPSARSGHTAVWTGREMIVYGGYGGERRPCRHLCLHSLAGGVSVSAAIKPCSFQPNPRA